MGSGAGKFIALGLIFVLALAIAGLITGAIGAGLTQSEEEKSSGETAEGPFIPKPEVHLPAQVIFPTSDRTHYRDFLHAEEEEKAHGEDSLTHEQEELVDEGPYVGSNFIITNTILSSWIASIVLVLLFALGARKAALVPGRFQNSIEIAIEGLMNFVTGVVGREHSRLIFPVIATIFLFVIIMYFSFRCSIFRFIFFICKRIYVFKLF